MMWPTQAQCRRFYGAPGSGHKRLVLPYQMTIAWDKRQHISSFTIHEKCHDSALRALQNIAEIYSRDEIKRLGLDLFGGCFNNRPMRGGSQLSMHAYACAIDFDPERNQLKWGKPKALLSHADAAPFWECWEKEGWISLGRVRNFDWMHVQAARL
jgi:hypothetical protein